MKSNELDELLFDLGKEQMEIPKDLNKGTYSLMKSTEERKETFKFSVLLSITLFITGLFSLIGFGLICISIFYGNYKVLAIAAIYLIIECGAVALMLLIKEVFRKPKEVNSL